MAAVITTHIMCRAAISALVSFMTAAVITATTRAIIGTRATAITVIATATVVRITTDRTVHAHRKVNALVPHKPSVHRDRALK